MKDDVYYLHGKKILHAKTGTAVQRKPNMIPVVVHQGELVVTGKDVKRVKQLLKRK